MFFVNWIIGPQLLALIFLIAGYIQKRFPPKTINGLYGYRTTAAMESQQAWDAANSFSTRLMIIYAWIMLLSGITVTALLNLLKTERDALVLIKIALMLIGAVIILVRMIRLTEKHIKQITQTLP